MHIRLLQLYLAILIIIGCTPAVQSPPIKSAEANDFDESSDVSPILAEGLTLDLWAPGPLLFNAVAVTFDNEGTAYVSETTRRKSSDIDIRAHSDWIIDDLSLQSLDDTRQFHLKMLDPSLSDKNIWMQDLNADSIRDYHDLMVQSEYINKVWDSDGDGRADKSQIYADGFDDMLTGIAAGILYHDGNLFMTAAPDLWNIQDTNDDGFGNSKKSLSHGYGIHIAFAGHDMSGLTVGMDGKLYWSIGDLGVNVKGPDGRQWKYPNQGCVMRCNHDGTDFEVFAHGLRNTQELAFDPYGNLISVDNDGDHPGEHERYVHIIEGSDSGWRINWQYGKYNQPNDDYKVWMDEKLYLPHFEGQAAYIVPTLALAYDGPAGLAFNPGTALGEEWKDYFFASYFTASAASSRIEAFQIQPNGASFKITNEKEVLSGIVPTGITFAPDGALYVNDWKDSYDKKEAGRLWKMDAKPEMKHPLSLQTETLLEQGMAHRGSEEVSELLAHVDQRIRLNAQFELVKRKAYLSLTDVAIKGKNILARLHAIWGMGQLSRSQKLQLDPLMILLNDKNHHIRGQVAKIFGESKFKKAEGNLISLIQDTDATVQFFAIKALGKLKSQIALEPIISSLEKTEETDPHLRHALAFALSKIASSEQLAGLSIHSSKFVRIGAVVALRHQRSSQVREFLHDPEVLVLEEAARAINDDFSIMKALPDLARRLTGDIVRSEAFTRRAINANLRIGDASSAMRLAEFAYNDNANLEMREDALWSLGSWSQPPPLDRVTGRYRGLSGHQLVDAQKAFSKVFESKISSNSNFIRALVQCIGRLKSTSFQEHIAAIYTNPESKDDMKIASLETLAQLNSKEILNHIESGLASKNTKLRQHAQRILGEVEMTEEEKLPLFDSILKNNTWPEKQVALKAISTMSSSKVEELLSNLFNQFLDDQIDKEIRLDLMIAIDASPFESVKKQKLEFERSLKNENTLEQYRAVLFGGDVKKGLNILSRNESAQCLRCHKIKEYGGVIGPELTNIASTLSRDELLRSLVSPSSRIAPGYGTVTLTLSDGTDLTGIFAEENESKIVIKEGHTLTTFQKDKIKNIDFSPSAMFNTADLLNKHQLRDLMAFLVTLK